MRLKAAIGDGLRRRWWPGLRRPSLARTTCSLTCSAPIDCGPSSMCGGPVCVSARARRRLRPRRWPRRAVAFERAVATRAGRLIAARGGFAEAVEVSRRDRAQLRLMSRSSGSEFAGNDWATLRAVRIRDHLVGHRQQRRDPSSRTSNGVPMSTAITTWGAQGAPRPPAGCAPRPHPSATGRRSRPDRPSAGSPCWRGPLVRLPPPSTTISPV